jgi:hypothetical protein
MNDTGGDSGMKPSNQSARDRQCPTVPRARVRRPQAVRTPEIESYILERIRRGDTLIAICDDEEAIAIGVPCRDTVFAWVARDKERRLAKEVVEDEVLFADRLTIAKEIRTIGYAEEIISISDDGRNDTYTDSDGRTVVDHDHIQRAKLRVETRKWLMAKLLPREYGDKPAEVNVSTNLHNHMPQTISAEFLEKMRQRRAVALQNYPSPKASGDEKASR